MAKAAKKKAAPKKAAKKAAKKAIKKAAKKAAPAKKVVTAAPATEGALAKRLAELEHEVGILQDKNEIKELHYKYGYYIDKCMWREAVDLFADKDSEVRFANGIYKGKAGAFRLYVGWFQKLFTGGYNGPIYGFLLDHMMMQLIIDLAPDRKTAKMRGRGFLIGGVHKSKKDPIVGVPNQFLEGGVYENIYVKENGVWKIKTTSRVSMAARRTFRRSPRPILKIPTAPTSSKVTCLSSGRRRASFPSTIRTR
jgi:hypothetical protein